MALVTGVALAQALEPYVPGVLLKWPNDVLVDGRKLAGILLETEIGASGLVDWLALGVGVNIASAPPDIGISLSGKTGRAMDPASIREEFLERLAVCYTLWQAEGLGPLRSLWLGKAHPPGTPLKIKLGAGGLDGYFEGLDAAGNLLLKQESGETRVIASGEVHFGGSETAHVTGD
jgi:BirA family biotin operon repressor/biotin-[acetyl-CoA-carboxylase] ligase